MAVSNRDKLGQVLVISLGIGVVQLDVVHLKWLTVVIGFAVDIRWQKELLGWEHKLGIADRFSVLINHTERNLFFLLCYTLCWCFLVPDQLGCLVIIQADIIFFVSSFTGLVTEKAIGLEKSTFSLPV